MDGALARGWRVNSPRDPAERGGTISVDCPHAKEVKSELIARNILVDYRPAAGVRLSPHFYNRDEEIDFALAQMEEILATRGLGAASAARLRDGRASMNAPSPPNSRSSFPRTTRKHVCRAASRKFAPICESGTSMLK